MYRAGRAVLRPLLGLLYRPRIEGRGNIPKRGGVLLASNHRSSWDTVLIPVASPRPVQFLTKSAYFNRPGRIGALQRWFFRSIGGVPVERAAGERARAALAVGGRILAAGRVFAVFPEGSRSRDGRLYDGHGGAAWMALETGATVIPVGLIGTARMRPFSPRGARVRIRFGRPVALGDLDSLPGGRARRAATERIMDAIAELTGQERAGELNPGSRDVSSLG